MGLALCTGALLEQKIPSLKCCKKSWKQINGKKNKLIIIKTNEKQNQKQNQITNESKQNKTK